MAARKWNPFLVVEIYRQLREGITDTDLCKSLKINRETYYRWIKEKPELRKVLEMVKKERTDREAFPAYVYSRLTPQLKELWNQIEKWEKEPTGVAKIELMLQDQGKRVRQQLFLHALCESSFNPSQALAKVNLSKRELTRWINEEPEFSELIDEIQWHKGNFFESRLVDMVQAGEPSAVIFANKSFNKDRGYITQTNVKVEGQVNVLAGVLDLSELFPYLTEDLKAGLMDAIRRREGDRAKQLSVTSQLSEAIAAVPVQAEPA